MPLFEVGLRWSGRPGIWGAVNDPFLGGSRMRDFGACVSFSSSEVPMRTRSANSETDFGSVIRLEQSSAEIAGKQREKGKDSSVLPD